MPNLIYPVSSDMQYAIEYKYRSKREDGRRGPTRDLYSSETPAGSKV